MPGTGKTTTISSIISMLVKLGKSVLLTSYTHTAVDNVLLKLQSDGVEFIRLGNRDKIHPRIAQHVPDPSSFKSVHHLDVHYRSRLVVATTTHGINQYENGG